MKGQYEDLRLLVPSGGKFEADWDRIMRSKLHPYFHRMAETMQNPEWHGEGDVLTHTKMVCESLIRLEGWRKLEENRREYLFIAALLHDIGKTACTRMENGLPVSPNHSAVGDRMVRSLLWKDFGLSGTAEGQQFRETVCTLIRHHSIPFHFYNDKSPERKAIQIAAVNKNVTLFSNELLALLVEADIIGRIAKDTPDRLEHLYFFREIAKESGCLYGPRLFPSSFSRYAYLSGRNILPGQELYDDTWGTVIMLSGLPGTGKDTYIKTQYSGLPVVSLDELRKKMKVHPKEPQGEVISAARNQAKEYLRKKQPFVWNATNLTAELREKQVDLFIRYKASVKIVFLETRWEEMLRRNQNRAEAVPVNVIEELLRKLKPPNPWEAHEVEWVLV